MEKVNHRKFADTPINYSTITTHMVLSYRLLPGAQQVFLYNESENGISDCVSYLPKTIVLATSYKIHYLVLLNFQGRVKWTNSWMKQLQIK